MSTLSARLVGGPTAIIEFAGMRWLTDPAFSPPGQYGALIKTTGPAIAVDELGRIAAFHGYGVADRLRLPGRGEAVEA